MMMLPWIESVTLLDRYHGLVAQCNPQTCVRTHATLRSDTLTHVVEYVRTCTSTHFIKWYRLMLMITLHLGPDIEYEL